MGLTKRYIISVGDFDDPTKIEGTVELQPFTDHADRQTIEITARTSTPPAAPDVVTFHLSLGEAQEISAALNVLLGSHDVEDLVIVGESE